MQNKTNWMKLLVFALVPFVAAFVRLPTSARTVTVAWAFDAAAVYKGKCVACHGKQAEKKFDHTKDDAALAEVILKGKDAKPLKMPAYETKGMTPEEAQALVTHMRSLHP